MAHGSFQANVQGGGTHFDAVQSTIELRTDDESRFHDITDSVNQFVASSGIQTGILVAQSMHTTAGLLLNECETGFKADLAQIIDQLVPSAVLNDVSYAHDDFSVRWENICPEDFEAPNGHSHIQHAIIGTPSVTLIVGDGKLVLGRWQRLFLLEFDRPRDRRVGLSAFGVMGPVKRPVPASGPPNRRVVNEDLIAQSGH